MIEQILYEINWQVKNDLGTNLYVDHIKKVDRYYKFNLNLSTPVFHTDSSTNEKMINYLILKDIARGTASKRKKISIKLPKFREVNKKVNLRLKILNTESERIVLNASSDNIAKLNEVDHYLKPIAYIASNIYHNDFFSTKERLSPKMNKYLNLLEDLKLIRKVDGGYKEESKFLYIKKKCNDFEEFKIAIYSFVLNNSYETLRNFFNFTFIDPYIKIENSYYTDSIESNKLLKRLEGEMRISYLKRYHYIQSYKFYPYLYDLIDVKCFEKENKRIVGIEGIYDKVSQMREEKIDFATLTY